MGYLRFFEEAIRDTYHLLDEKNQLYLYYEKELSQWLDTHMSKLSASQRFSVISMLQTDLFGDSSLDIVKIAYMMDCSEKTARKILAEAGPLLSSTKDGKKLIWHINLNTLSTKPSG